MEGAVQSRVARGCHRGLRGRFLVAVEKRAEQHACHQLPSTSPACASSQGPVTLLQGFPPPIAAVSAAALARSFAISNQINCPF